MCSQALGTDGRANIAEHQSWLTLIQDLAPRNVHTMLTMHNYCILQVTLHSLAILTVPSPTNVLLSLCY